MTRTGKAASGGATTADGPRRIALVTGASSGLGETFARQLARKGYDLVLVARRRDRLDRLAEEITKAGGARAEVLEADLSRPEGVAMAEERIARGGVEMLVNCAGFGTLGEFAQLPVERELEEIDLNVRALTRLSHAALGQMTKQKRGTIINVGSTGSFQPVPYMATYAATKAFVLHFSEALHEEAKKYGVTVTCLCPGPVKTEFQEVSGVRQERLRVGWTSAEKVVSTALKAAARGKAIAVPGGFNQITSMSTRFAPRFLVRKVAGAVFRNAGDDQRA